MGGDDLAEKGRLSLHRPADKWVDDALVAAPLREASLTIQIALESQRVELPHRDPADRFLVATASVFELTLVTADKRLLGLQCVALLPNH